MAADLVAPASYRPPSISHRNAGRALAWRYELKYVVPPHVRTPLTKDLRAFADFDRSTDGAGYYRVRSLYFDTPTWACFHDKQAGVARRHKLRIRVYGGDGTTTSSVKFEVKHRQGDRVAKQVVSMNVEKYYELLPDLLAGRLTSACLLPRWPELRPFLYLKHNFAMAPVMLIAYRRQALMARAIRGVRITLDDQLTATRARDVFAPVRSPRHSWLGAQSILEIKTSSTLPRWLAMLTSKYQLKVQSVSKYCRGMASGPFGLDVT